MTVRLAFYSGEERKNQQEACAGEQHQERDDDFCGGVAVGGYACVADTEAAGTCRRHRVGYGVKPVDSGELQRNDSQQRNCGINTQHYGYESFA